MVSGKVLRLKSSPGNSARTWGISILQTAWEEILKRYAGTELFDYLQTVSKKSKKIAVKPQYIDFIPKLYSGTIRDLLKKTDERGRLDELVPALKLDAIIDHEIGTLSGGELQRVAITACLARNADLYFLDEITPFLDIYQRISAAKLIRELATEHPVVIVEHDLAILDMLADTVHIGYGKPGVFGVITRPKGVRVGINQYLEGYLAEENVRFRDTQVVFEKRAHDKGSKREDLVEVPPLTKNYETFKLTISGGTIKAGEVLGVIGANGMGKSTFAKLLAGVEKPDSGTMDTTLKISYKPQYIKAETSDSVEMFLRHCTSKFDSSYYQHEILEPLSLQAILQSPVDSLSGGELQRVAIAACLSRDADLYILDEPSAHLDVEQRVKVTRLIKHHAEGKKVAILVIDHDIYLIDMISERILVFEGEPGVKGTAAGPFAMREGMNRFLKALDVTFRRDQTGARINKPESFLDREQKSRGEYYYYAADDE